MSDISSRAPDVSVDTVVRRTPQPVWDAVADPRRITSWSPEAHAVSDAGGATGPMPVHHNERTMRETLAALAADLEED
jgi:uncharacterized protein YndB with AHSA1/START domain